MTKELEQEPPSDLQIQGDFTVLMPTYNRYDLKILFESSVASIYSNTLKAKEVIIVIDGKVDNEFEAKIKKLQQKYNYKLIWIEKNSGLTKALNTGLFEVKTRYTFRADGDDINHSQRFKMLYDKLNEGYDLVGSLIQERELDGTPLKCRKVPLEHKKIKSIMRFRNPFNHMTVGFSTELAKSVGGYPDIYLREDYGLWASMLEAGAKTANIDNILVTATTGKALHARRSGGKYVRAETEIQRHLINTKISSLKVATVAGIFRAIIFAMPRLISSNIYKLLLRQKL